MTVYEVDWALVATIAIGYVAGRATWSLVSRKMTVETPYGSIPLGDYIRFWFRNRLGRELPLSSRILTRQTTSVVADNYVRMGDNGWVFNDHLTRAAQQGNRITYPI